MIMLIKQLRRLCASLLVFLLLLLAMMTVMRMNKPMMWFWYIVVIYFDIWRIDLHFTSVQRPATLTTMFWYCPYINTTRLKIGTLLMSVIHRLAFQSSRIGSCLCTMQSQERSLSVWTVYYTHHQQYHGFAVVLRPLLRLSNYRTVFVGLKYEYRSFCRSTYLSRLNLNTVLRRFHSKNYIFAVLGLCSF